MKKIISFMLLSFTIISFSQITSNQMGGSNYLSPYGLLDNIFDQYGNKLNLADIKIPVPLKSSAKTLSPIATPPLDCGYYRLYFETGCGFENDSDPTINATNLSRRMVLKQVFEDLSAFINSPLTTSTTNTKVNIWVRNIINITTDNSVLGLATSFYNLPQTSLTGVIGGIADNEIWKTIHAGVDSFTNVNALLSSGTTSISGQYFHGVVAFNFNKSWNTNLSIMSPIDKFDLYTIMLHEIIHSLGFASQINEYGNSLFGSWKYYSRYDKFLKNNSTNDFLITNNSSCSVMYNYQFNPILSNSILKPSCTNPYLSHNTICSTAIKYVGLSTVPVYTPPCFELGSSFSHFEDQCILPPNQNNTNSYFTMTDANGMGVTKRFLQTEERNVLCDLGYSINSTYGNNLLVANSYKNYTTSFSGIIVAGINDGINSSDGNFTYIGSASLTVGIQLNGFGVPNISFLSNDKNATGFECLQDLSSSSSILNVTSGTSTTLVTFKSNVEGLHLLRYVPTYGSQKGNITYIYVKVKKPICAVALPNEVCNLVWNGGFEQNTGIPFGAYSESHFICNWFTPNSGTPDYYHRSTPPPSFKIPCLLGGYQDVNPVYGGNAFVGLYNLLDVYLHPAPMLPYRECIGTKLKQKLVANVTYRLSFDISLAEAYSRHAYKIQAYLSDKEINVASMTDIPILNTSMLFQDSDYCVDTVGWRRVTFTFTSTTGNEEYLYLGFLKDTPSTVITPSSDQTCSTENYYSPYPEYLANKPSYYYLDNVELISTTQPTIQGSSTACTTGNNTVTYTTTTNGGTPTWSAIGGQITSPPNQSFVTVLWYNLPGQLTLNVTNNGCSSSVTKNITSFCPCNCLDGLMITGPFAMLDNTFRYKVNTSTNSVCGSLKFTWNFSDGTSITTTSNQQSVDTSIKSLVSVTIKQYDSNNAMLCSVTLLNNGGSSGAKSSTNSNENTSSEKQIVINNEGFDINISPNPSTGIYNIRINQFVGKLNIEVVDVNGRLILNDKNIDFNTEKTINLSNFQSGIYILKITGENVNYSQKLIKN